MASGAGGIAGAGRRGIVAVCRRVAGGMDSGHAGMLSELAVSGVAERAFVELRSAALESTLWSGMAAALGMTVAMRITGGLDEMDSRYAVLPEPIFAE